MRNGLTGGKVEVYRNEIEYDPELYEELDIQPPDDMYELICGMEPAKTFTHIFSKNFDEGKISLDTVYEFFSDSTCGLNCTCFTPKPKEGQTLESYLLCQPHFRNIQWYRELAVILDEVLERPLGQSDELIEYTLDWVSSCIEKKERLVEGLKTLEEPPPWGVVEVDANSLYPTQFMCPTPGGSIKFSS